MSAAGKPATLTNINFELQEGKLMIVVGPVGAGKSSLLAALLGEMSGTKTAASVAGHMHTFIHVPCIVILFAMELQSSHCDIAAAGE